MMEQAEIERIVDDLETKAEQAHQDAYYNSHSNALINHYYFKGRREAYEQAATVLKQVLPHE